MTQRCPAQIATVVPTLVLVLVGFALVACEPKSPSGSGSGPAGATIAVSCSAEEMQTRRARTPACEAQFRDLLAKAEADRRRNAAISAPPPAPPRDRF